MTTEATANDGLRTGDRRYVYVLVKGDEAKFFNFASIPGWVAVRQGPYTKNGKWSNSTWDLTLADDVRLVEATPRLHGYAYQGATTWGECARFLGVSVASAKALLLPTSLRRAAFDQADADLAAL